MADQKINLTIKVNSETGQLEVVGAKLKEVGEKAKKVGGDFDNMGKEAKNLLASLLPFATGAGLVAFFTAAVKGAEEENQALRRLSFTLQAHNQNVQEGTQQIQAFAAAIQKSTRFSDTEAFNAIDKLLRVTGNLAQAQKAAALAMDLSVTSGQKLENTTQIVTDLMNGNERALRQVRNEFGSFVGDANTTQEALDRLSASLAGAAENEKSLTKDTLSLKNQWADFTDQIGNSLAGPLSMLISWAKEGIVLIDKLGTVFAANAAIIFEVCEGIGQAIKAAFKLDPEGVKQAATQTMADVALIVEESAAQMEAVEQRKTATLELQSIQRTQLVAREADEEARKREELGAKASALADQLNQRVLSVEQKTLQQKLALLKQQEQAEMAKLDREYKGHLKLKELKDKANEFYRKKEQQEIELDTKIKTAATLEIADLSIQALTVINSMSELKSKEDVRRAKLLLALEKGIAIAKAIAAAQDAGPLAAGIAAAQIALITAQFAQQTKALDDARRTADQGRQEFKLSTDLPGGSELEKVFTEGGGPAPVLLPGGGAAAAPGVSSGGGAVVNISSINVNLQTDHIDLANIDLVMRRIKEAVLQGGVEAAQAAVAIVNLATRKGDMAV